MFNHFMGLVLKGLIFRRKVNSFFGVNDCSKMVRFRYTIQELEETGKIGGNLCRRTGKN